MVLLLSWGLLGASGHDAALPVRHATPGATDRVITQDNIQQTI